MKIEVYSPTIRRKEMDAVLTAMVEDRIGPGEHARSLVHIAREHIHFDYALSLRSPVMALYFALKALNAGKGQGVIVSALSPRYYTPVIEGMGLRLIYCDVSASSPCPGKADVEAALRSGGGEAGVCAVVLHHALGYKPDTAGIAELGVSLIEDRSRSYGGMEDERETAGGVFTILGLEDRDMLTSGGGALLYAMNRRDASVLRNYGELPREYCLPDINAALAVVQFRESAKNLKRREEIAAVYTQASLRGRHKRFVQRDETGYNNYAFPLILETGLKDVKAYAKKKDIMVESAFDDTLINAGALEPGRCPESYSLSLRTVLFPLYPRLRAAEIERVSKLIGTIP
ncbi:MAG: DegT/DnrJ/EryC1/StrS family aminotransferase [Treponema sp.]|jgi:dTDP-4-amino-4,6-dideoxygalactose transaminase|nr:DegT/DnrJ/EryC1/StrS family aminotransferase [Treponema sp.]